LIDADTPCYAAAAVHEADDVEYAIMEANDSIQRLINDTNATSFSIYLTGENNFRYNIFPEYKAHRLKMVRPRHLDEVRANIARGWDAIVSQGCEADDLLGIEQCRAHTFIKPMDPPIYFLDFSTEKLPEKYETCIATIDKDLDQIPGWHYNPGIKRKGEFIREPRKYFITPEQGLHFFYYQLLIGDHTDNIKGAPGIGPKKAENILTGCETAWDYYQAVAPFFSCEEELLQNARCVYIWQKESDRKTLWTPPLDPSKEAQLHSERTEDRDKAMAA
jgi:5'-3' exonuclease